MPQNYCSRLHSPSSFRTKLVYHSPRSEVLEDVVTNLIYSFFVVHRPIQLSPSLLLLSMNPQKNVLIRIIMVPITKALIPQFRHSLYGARIINIGSDFGKLIVRPSHCECPMNIDFHVFFSDL